MSNIPYRAIPISLENNSDWLSLSLKRRALFLFLVFESVSSATHEYRGRILTYGQYVWSYNKLCERFNETLTAEDQYSKMACHKAIETFCKLGFIKAEKYGTGVHAETLITILHPECYELLKNKQCTAFNDQCTTSVQPNDSTSVQQQCNKKQSQNTSTGNNKLITKTTSVQPEISLNNEQCTTIQNLTESTLTTMFRKDNVQTVPLFTKKDDVASDIAKKFKLSDDQNEIYEWLLSQKIDSAPTTLSFWAKTYSFKRIKEAHKAAVKAKQPKNGKKKSVGALMNHFLKNETPLESDAVNSNAEFAFSYVSEFPEMKWVIGNKFATCEIRGIKKEISLNYHPDRFVDEIIRLINNYKGI